MRAAINNNWFQTLFETSSHSVLLFHMNKIGTESSLANWLNALILPGFEAQVTSVRVQVETTPGSAAKIQHCQHPLQLIPDCAQQNS